MEPSFLSLIPPFVILILGFTTRRILLSLAAGLFIAAMIKTGANPLAAVILSCEKLFTNLEFQQIYNNGLWSGWNILICIFLFILGIFITLLHHSGAANAYKTFVSSKLKSKKQAEASTLIMSSALFVDDYFSSLTVGSIMKSVTDNFKIPRAKIAFLVDSMAAPLAIICPVSSWVAATVGFLKSSGVAETAEATTSIHGSPFIAYLNILPYILYSLAIIVGSWAIVILGLSFGKMAEHEKIASQTGHLFGNKKVTKANQASSYTQYSGNLYDFVIMILVLIISVLCGLAYSGKWSVTGGGKSIVEAFRDSSAAQGLFIGGLVVFCFQITWMLSRKLLKISELPKISYQGVKLMATSVCVLILAWTLGDLLNNDLKTGEFLASVFTDRISSEWLPLVFFIVSVITSTCIGSSWGTAAIMFPIAVNMYISLKGGNTLTISEANDLFPILGAVLSGAVAGDHISPISDTTIMSATSTAMDHIDHVETQMGYAIPLIIVTACSFACFGFLSSAYYWIAYVTTILGSIGILTTLHSLNKRKVK